MCESIGRVAVIEDEQAVLDALRAERFNVVAFADLRHPRDGPTALPDLVILDVILPRSSGFELARSLRVQHELPIIFLTARDAVADRVAGPELGGRDAIPRVLEVARLLVDEEHGLAALGGREIALTSTELGLLAYLMRDRGQALSNDQLPTRAWGHDAYDHNLVEVHLSALRRTMEADAPRLIHTVRGIGYRFSA